MNKLFDLIEKDPNDFKTFRKQAHNITSLKAKWKENMKEMEEEAFSDKEKINFHIESVSTKIWSS